MQLGAADALGREERFSLLILPGSCTAATCPAATCSALSRCPGCGAKPREGQSPALGMHHMGSLIQGASGLGVDPTALAVSLALSLLLGKAHVGR